MIPTISKRLTGCIGFVALILCSLISDVLLWACRGQLALCFYLEGELIPTLAHDAHVNLFDAPPSED